MTTTYDDSPNPIENGVQQVYNDVRESLALILWAELPVEDHVSVNERTAAILNSLDDAVSNNWDELMHGFWEGVRQDVDNIYGT